MKLHKKLFSVLAILFCLICPCVTNKQFSYATTTNKNKTVNQERIRYNIISNKEMPIVAYMAMPPANANDGSSTSDNPSGMTYHNFLTYKEAGFNILCGLYDKIGFKDNDVRKALELCEMLDIPYLINDPAFSGDTKSGTIEYASTEDYKSAMLEKWYLQSDAFGGFALKDEPSIKDFDAMKNISSALNQIDSGKISHTTLFPCGVEPSRLDLPISLDFTGSYDTYVRLLMEKVNPNVLIFDKYLFFNNNNIEDISAIDLNLYVNNISIIRKYSQQYNTPFWANIATFNHINKANYTYKQMLWTVNFNLAYGAQGIQYYTYWDNFVAYSSINDWNTESGAGAITYTGAKKENYYEIQKINENIKVVDEILMNSKHIGVMQIGKQIVPVISEDCVYSYGPLKEIVGGDLFVGCFDHNGKPAYYIMNNSTESATKTFTARFLKNINSRISNNQTIQTFNNTTSIGFNLTAGQAILLEVL